MDPNIGRVLGGYRIESELGRGGMGAVYLAGDVRLDRKVALKILTSELATDQRFRDRFIRESQIAASLEHPNIVPIHEAGELDGLPFIAMRYVRGTDLRRLIDERGPLDPALAATIISAAGSALDAAHAEGLVHRDVKPANILLASPEDPARLQVYLSDFGLTKRLTSDSGITKTGQFLGTIDYAAPEQFEGRPLDGRTDVYSLGCVLYESLTGQPPFRRDQEAAVMYAHLRDPAPKPTALRAELPAGIDAVVARAMAKRPEDRYPTAGALAAATREALGVSVAAPGAPRPVRRRRTLALVAGAAAAVVALVVGIVLALSAGGGPSRPASHAGPAVLTVNEVDPKTGRVLATATDLDATDLAVGENGVWAYLRFTTVAHVDPKSGKEVATTSVGYGHILTVGEGAVWVATQTGVEKIDPATDEAARTFPIAPSIGFPAEIVVGDGSLWTLYPTRQGNRLVKIDAGRDRLADSIKVSPGANSVGFGAGSVWVTDKLASTLTRIDPATDRVIKTIHLGTTPDRVIVGEGGVWVVNFSGAVVTDIDPRTYVASDPISVGKQPADIAIGLGAVWVTSPDGTITRINPLTHQVTTIEVRAPMGPIAVDEKDGTLWVGVGRNPGE